MSRFLLDTNIVSDLVRHPQGRVAERIAKVGEQRIATSVVVAAELRYGAAKKGSTRLQQQLGLVLNALEVLPLEPPVDRIYGDMRSQLEHAGTPIGGNDLLIAAQAVALEMVMVTANMREFRRVPQLELQNWLALRG